MGKFSNVLLATDYDDTLYGSTWGISRENRQAIRYFTREGGHFTISTGRSRRNFSIQLEREDLPINTPVILANGANIYDFQQGRMLYECTMPATAAEDLRLLCRLLPALGLEVYYEGDVYVHNPNVITYRHLDKAGLRGVPLPIGEMPAPWIKVILQSEDNALLAAAQAEVQHRWPERYEAIFSSRVLLEMTARGCHKGSAVLWLAEYLHIPRHHIYCVGNGHNDIPMLRIAAEPFAPANCAPAVREQGATILASCDDSCIARLIDTLDRRYSRGETDAAAPAREKEELTETGKSRIMMKQCLPVSPALPGGNGAGDRGRSEPRWQESRPW